MPSAYSNEFELFRKEIPFLRLIPDEIYLRLDITEFLLPYGRIKKAREELETLCDGYVMTYKADTFIRTNPISSHLCANLRGKDLTA